ncbi:glucosyltransferase [Pandoraea thiooxydans]|uniref:glucans biosynthesis glucosyltransferase MdoH n=1 Tax=Pandoraea thiooxydans TaxID=445709 RepID=UPI00064081AF|nr:glucans biosynthesis glucosyltransferase MdoH [Pandoraea thiooxydans]APR96500.1 glucosyltransferase [Pandoraea thiooxydans]
MELPVTPRINRREDVPASERYADQLPLSDDERQALLAQVGGREDGDAQALLRLHRALAGDASQVSDEPAYGSVFKRLELAYGAPQADTAPVIAEHGRGGGVQIVSAPTVARTPIGPHPWSLNPLSRWLGGLFGGRARAPAPDSPDPRGRWRHAGRVRRMMLLVLTLAQTALATHFMSTVLPYQGRDPLEIVALILFAILFCWVSAGFWTAIMGFFVLLFGRDRYVISRTAVGQEPLAEGARTAVVMPICNENVPRVFAGLRATYESLAKTDDLAAFDFFVLSDSNDPDVCVAETDAWLSLCRAVDGFGRIFYRRRQRRVKRKSGNIDDFCRRWGGNYRYMIVLDADSIMSGECLGKLARMMEANPGAGIIQTAPLAAGRETFYARLQQFASRVYGPLFTAGLHYWQLGESHYWGHNAIIRLAPFMKHCALAPLPGSGVLTGEILSHDFVEAALMRRAGWGVWIAYDLQGSYEEMPPNLLDELKRDRRWCQGNLMNFRLFLAERIHGVHRAVFVTGVMAYLSSPLWFLFLLLSTVMLAKHTLVAPQYFVAPRQLFPLWPQWHPERAIALFSATATLLFLPKILSVILLWFKDATRFGGVFILTLGLAIEMLLSALLAPIRMLFHTQFVVAAFTGWSIQWKSPPREDAETTWGEALRRHGWHSLLGIVWAAGVYWLNPAYLLWLLPIVGALALSVPLSVFSSRVSLGQRLRRMRLFLIPEESWPPKELRWAQKYAEMAPAGPDFVKAVVDPVANAVACASARLRPARCNDSTRRAQWVREALANGPEVLPDKQKSQLLSDPLALSALHLAVWTQADAHPGWRAALSGGLQQGYLRSSL